ncbi:hypothetical protein H5410_010218 [Solanum commersonii]|uniref:BURP domain-containing protein n=1 Tax=Solanum commersonii TaxID=4109 RepID=A0A9J6AK33_SOLCO|nr:hypothetical protein H5410_010218 [Solanum commersonii]
MDLKLGFYVLSLNILIQLVAYGAEARKMVEGNLQGKILNSPLAQIGITSYGNLQNTDNTENYLIYNNHQQAKTENAQIGITSYGDLQNEDDTQNYLEYNSKGDNNHQQAKTENAQIGLTSYGNLQNEDDTQNYLKYNNRGDNNHQQAKTENAQIGLSSYGDLRNEEDTQNYLIYNNKGDNNHQQAKTENAQIGLTSYGNLQNEDDTQNYLKYNNRGDNNHQQAKTENAQIGLSSYGDLRNEDDTQNYLIGNNHQEAKTENAHIHSSSHIDPSLRVFFLMDDLKLKKEIFISFPRRDLSPSPKFLSKEEANSIPFSLKELPNLLQRFAFSRNSPEAKTMEETLKVCGIPPIKGETKYCATSPKAMIDFVQEIMGEKTEIKALSTTHFSNSTPLLQKYTILDTPEEVETPKMVACHTMPYAYGIFYCHHTVSKSKVFKVSLGGENGDKVEAIVVCHLDTSAWSPSHVSFRVLGISSGTCPICHFFPSDNLLWVPKFAIAQVI